jgi:hypothetical protein
MRKSLQALDHLEALLAELKKQKVGGSHHD